MFIAHLDETYRANIRNYLIHRAHAVRVDAKGNLLSLAGLSEDFYVEFLNILLDLRLENANASEHNKAGIDLIDREHRVAAQVSVTYTKEKIRLSIVKYEKPIGESWQFYFVPIKDEVPDRKLGLDLPEGLTFDEKRDVLDIARIMELATGIDKLRGLSELVDKYSKAEADSQALRDRLDQLLQDTWKAHRSNKLMQTDEIDKRLLPGIKESNQKESIPLEALGKREGEEAESPVWSIIRESWKEPTNRPVMIQGAGGIGKTVTLFSVTEMNRDQLPAPAVYVPMFELVDCEGKVVNLTDYFHSTDAFPSLTPKQRDELCVLAKKSWAGPSLLVLLDGFNEVPGKLRWNVLQMLRDWHGKNHGAQLIAVTRPMDNLSIGTAFGKQTISITLSELTKESVTAYLKSPQGEGVRIPEPHAPIWKTIVYPLFLNLYIKADRLRDQEVWQNYPLDSREAAGPGSVIWNYLQRELLRHENEQWILRCALANEYFAPILAYRMLQSYDYTISQSDALAVLKRAVSEMNFDRMPAHIMAILSHWKSMELSIDPPLLLKDLNWPDILLRECGLLVPYREIGMNRNNRKQEARQEPRFEFLHQNFRDCLAGLYLVNQAEIAGKDEFPGILERSQNHLALKYAAELMGSEVYMRLWEANRKAQQYQQTARRKKHTATCNLLELCKWGGISAELLNFSGMDLEGLSLTRYLAQTKTCLPLFQNRDMTFETKLNRATFQSEGHTGYISCIVELSENRFASGGNDNVICIWDSSTGRRVQLLEGHMGKVNCIAALPDGCIVSGSDDRTLRVWDTVTGICKKILGGHTGKVNCVAVLRDGHIVSGSDDGTIRLWNPIAGKCLKKMTKHADAINCIAVLKNGRIVSGSGDCSLRVWDTATDDCLELVGHTGIVNCVAVLSNGRVVSGSKDNTLRVWDSSTGQCLQTLRGHTNQINCIAVLSEEVIVSGANDHTIGIWNLATGQLLKFLIGHTGVINCISALSESCVISASSDWTLRVWDTATGQQLHVLKKHQNIIECLTVLNNGQVVSGSHDDTLCIWEPDTGQLHHSIEGHYGFIYCSTLLQNGDIVSGSDDFTLRVWDSNKKQCIKTFRGHQGSVYTVITLSTGCVISGSWDNTLKIWDMTTCRCLSTLNGHTKPVRCAAILSGERIVSGSDDNTLRVWDIPTGQCLQTLKEHTAIIRCVAVLPNGRIISGSDDCTLRVWDIATGKCLNALEGHTGSVRCVAVLQDGSVISGSDDRTLRVWDIATGKCLETLVGHTDSVRCVAVLQDGSVISGSNDRTLRIWDVGNGNCLPPWEGHKDTINCITILKDGRIVSGSNDRTMKIWDPYSGQCLDTLEAIEVDISNMHFSENAIINPDLVNLLEQNSNNHFYN